MSQNRYCYRSLIGHPVLWTQKEAITAIITWTTDPSLELEAIWPLEKHDFPVRDNTSIPMAPSLT